jgi:NAD(P)-dependent dehydrogenase (short-subunit alcohol dehydrogenase family)
MAAIGSGSGSVVVIGGNRGIGREIARHYAEAGDDVVITATDAARAEDAADEIGDSVRGLELDLTRPNEIRAALESVGPVKYLVVVAIDRDDNRVADYSIEGALRLVTLKLVGYTEVVHVLLDRMAPDGAIVLFGGLAKDRPYPGSTTVSTVNGGVVGMVRTLVSEIAPIRINALHPGIVGDSPFWKGKSLDHVLARTPTKRLTEMADIVDGVRFLLENRAVNGIDLRIDGGWMTT